MPTRPVEDAKQALDIPVIASINCRSNGKWIEYAKRFSAVGADAIEPTTTWWPRDVEVDGAEVEKSTSRWSGARARLGLPLFPKMSPAFSSLANMLRRLMRRRRWVCFNRFYNLTSTSNGCRFPHPCSAARMSTPACAGPP